MGKLIGAIAALSLIFGVLTLAVPKTLARMGKVVNRKVIPIDNQVLKYHIGVGICLILAGIFLLVYGYRLG